MSGFLKHFPRWWLALVISLSPIIVTIFLLRFVLNVNFLDYTPRDWNDTSWYWHQTLSFSQVGLNSGYYVIDEKVPRWEGYKFSSSGPLFPVIYGFLGHFTGWQAYTGVLYNMVFLAVAVLAFIYMTGLNRLQILGMGATLLLVGPVLFYLPLNSQETFHQGSALILAGVFYRLWRIPTSWRFKLFAVVWLMLMSQLRVSWALLFIPLFLSMLQRLRVKTVIAALVVAGTLGIITVMAVSFMSSAGHNSMFRELNQITTSPQVAFEGLLKVINGNLEGTFLRVDDLQKLNLNHVQGVQIALICGVALVLTFSSQMPQVEGKPRLEGVFHLYNLLAIILVALPLYIAYGYYRVFGPHLLLSLALLIACQPLRGASGVVVVSILTLNLWFGAYKEVGGNFLPNSPDLAVSRREWAAYMPYQAQVSPWCNTVLVPIILLDRRILYIPAGIGITMLTSHLDTPMKSHYLLVDEENIPQTRLRLGASWDDLKRVATTPFGTVYQNTAVNCP